MVDLISREAVLDELKEQCRKCPLSFGWGLNRAINVVFHAPAVDAVEVVRCGECKYYEDHKLKVFENCVRKGRYIPMQPNDFCSYGERREENAAD